jgi:hypothetical protein
MSTYDDASLVLVPSGYKNGVVFSQKPMDANGQLTFTRASSATRVGPNGYIEKVRTNLILQSETFDNASWIKLNSATVTANTSVAPDGTTTADTLTLTTNTSSSIAQAITTISELTFSVYAKVASGTKNFRLRFDRPADISSADFTATTTWQRFTFTATTTGSGNVYIINDSTGTAGDLIIWGAQLETGDIATDYIDTTTAAVSVGPVSGTPRLDYLGSDCPRLLLEPQRSNVATNSETFGASTGTTIVLNNTASPDGYVSADKLVEDTSTGVHITTMGGSLGGSVDSSVYCVSVFAKASGRTRINIFDNNQASAGTTNFDIANGVVISGTGKIENYGNGWYRCSIFPAKTDSTISNVQIRLIDSGTNVSYTGNGTSGVFLWGKQIEAAAYATSYIPTLGTAVTRVADDCVKTSATSIIGQTEGVIYINWDYKNSGSSGGNVPICLDGGLGNEVYFYGLPNGNYECEMYVSSVLQFKFSGSLGSFGTKKIAIAYKQNDFALYVNGVQVGTDTSGSVPAMNRLYVGRFYGNTTLNIASGVSEVLLFKTRLTNAQLAELTTL